MVARCSGPRCMRDVGDVQTHLDPSQSDCRDRPSDPGRHARCQQARPRTRGGSCAGLCILEEPRRNRHGQTKAANARSANPEAVGLSDRRIRSSRTIFPDPRGAQCEYHRMRLPRLRWLRVHAPPPASDRRRHDKRCYICGPQALSAARVSLPSSSLRARR